MMVNAIVGLLPTEDGCEVALGVDVSGRFSTSVTFPPDAADRLAVELHKAAQAAREQSPASRIATPIKKIVIPGR
jgi:hypothetical protein